MSIGLKQFGSAPLGAVVAVLGSSLAVYGTATGVAFLGIPGIVLGNRRARARMSIDSGTNARPR
ncbi:hypothetical protein [Microbacterium sp. NPDC077184]|uniref:hypothetical protein n=1 Tax=Microbacterium sp. NPDC077184 TaxID=3154764 RepID=UPI003415111C